MDALRLSKDQPFITAEMAIVAGKKCKELGADGFFVTLGGDKFRDNSERKITFHFVKQPSPDEFDDIREAMNPLANIFMWSNVIEKLRLEIGLGGEINWEEAEQAQE